MLVLNIPKNKNKLILLFILLAIRTLNSSTGTSQIRTSIYQNEPFCEDLPGAPRC